jgi:glycosyltransferase involved in cell wall biosynthesis
MTRVAFFLDVPHRMAGAQRSLLAVLPHLHRYGVEPLAVAPAPGMFVDRVREAGVAVTVLDAPAAYQTFGKALLRLGPLGFARTVVRELVPYARTLDRFFDSERIDVVHANTPRGMLGAGPGAKLGCRKTVLHLRGTPGFGGPMWLAAQALSDRIVLVANVLRDAVHPRFRSRARVVYNGAAPPELASREECRAKLKDTIGPIGTDEVVALSLSSPVPFKGLHVLVEAAAKVKERGIPLRVIAAGAGAHPSYEAWLRGRIDGFGLGDQFHLIGHVADPFSLICAADFVVLPSVDRCEIDIGGETVVGVSNEGFPRSVLEAMFAGVPTIATRIAGTVEQIEDRETGLLIPQNDVGALEGAMIRLASSGELRARLGAAAKLSAERRFSLDSAASGLAAVLDEV